LEIKKACGTDTKKIKAYLKKEHNIELEWAFCLLTLICLKGTPLAQYVFLYFIKVANTYFIMKISIITA
jgi:hypothetical protein